MTKNDWDEINSFASKTGLKILFDVNVLLRKGKEIISDKETIQS